MNYLRQVLVLRYSRDAGPLHVLFCMADHFEPGGAGISVETMNARVERWVRAYPLVAAGHRDSDGMPPRHTFFYPAEQYSPDLLERLAGLVRSGWGEIEVHLHHDRDSRAGFREKIEEFKARLLSHGLLGREVNTGTARYGFIHGNWALDNSAANGRWCGVSGELKILRETGCYADFTLPSAPSETQTRKINAIYYATGHPARAKGHDTGIDVRVGGREEGDIMLIQGPLALDWRRRKYGLLPRIEVGAITPANPGTAARARLWLARRIHVRGRPDWVVVKVHTHGAAEDEAEHLLGGGLGMLWSALETEFKGAASYRLHYVTARELYSIVKAAEEGLTGDPSTYRDYRLALPK